LCPKAIEGRYLLNAKVEESFSLVQKALSEIGLKDLKMKRLVPSSYILLEYKAGWLDKRQIELVFKDKQNKTEVSVKWFYPSYEEYESLVGKKDFALWKVAEKEEEHKTERLLEELKSRIGAIEVPLAEEEKVVREKEVIKEKEVIIKIRCPYCHNLYDETLDKCPHCGAKR
jgi:hypothetical protein